MISYNNIEGNQLFDMFHRLIQEQTLLKVSLPGTDFESLTVLTATKSQDHQHFFQIDMPEGFSSASRQLPLKTLQFEFTGEGQLAHRFEAVFQDIKKTCIWLAFPESIQRFQMRNNFRIKVHRNSFAAVKAENEIALRMGIDNISVGGVYCYCPNRYKSLFQVNTQFEDMELNITTRRDCFLVQIEQAVVKRIEPWMRPKHFGVAFEFLHIHKMARQHLIQRIYELQRDFLQGRLKLNT